MPFVTVIYVVTNMSYLTVLAPTEIIHSDAVAITWAQRLFAHTEYSHLAVYAEWVVSAFVAMSTFGAANGSLFSSGRMPFVAARERHLPEILASVHDKRHTPAVSMVFCVSVASFNANARFRPFRFRH